MKFVCTKCHQSKTAEQFGEYTRSGKQHRYKCCLDCRSARSALLRSRYKQDWIEFLSSEYGLPQCQICDRQLEFLGGDLEMSVCFDHRHDDHTIDIGPSTWMLTKPCNSKNKQFFRDNSFGILCRKCNSRMPTENRKDWLYRAARYANVISEPVRDKLKRLGLPEPSLEQQRRNLEHNLGCMLRDLQ